jgi:deoxycytidylate deaminase
MSQPLHPSAGRDLELVFALAGPAGADLEEVSRTLGDALRKCEYRAVEEVDVETVIWQLARACELPPLVETPEELRIASYMDGANAIRRRAANPALIAVAAMAHIRRLRDGVPSRRAYIVRSVKRPEEAQVLRRVYGPGFFLIGVNVNRPSRVASLAARIARSHNETPASPNFPSYVAAAEELAMRDEDDAADDFGQRLRDVYQLCDLFVSADMLFPPIDRFVRLILGDHGETPFADEQFMFHAQAASLMSGALGRQVGAVLVSPHREVLGVGCNEVPKGGGGLYRAGEHYDRRDLHVERDSVNVHADQILAELLEAERRAGWLAVDVSLEQAREVLRKSRLMSLLEFGRTTHAEMEALLAAARIGATPRDATLYTTTFPCHQCARSIVAAGVRRVVYIEPYPKSRALDLHRDAIAAYDDPARIDCGDPHCEELHAVELEPFHGVAPHRFAELFSMTTSAGEPRDRKARTGERIRFDPRTAFRRWRCCR